MAARQPLPILRTSERTTYKRCPWRWHQSYVRGLTLRNPRVDARWFGTGIHLCKAEWYVPGRKRGRDMHETWDEYAKDHYAFVMGLGLIDDEFQSQYVEANQLAHAMIDGHLEKYGHDESWEVIAAEQRFSVLIPHPSNSHRAVGRFVGTIDLIIRDLETGYVWLNDTKTASRIYTHHLPLLEQPAGYVAVGTHVLREMGLIGPKERIRGIIFDFMKKQMPDTRPINPATGLRCNKPLKKHYAAALDGVGNWDAATLMKKKLDELESIAAANRIVVYGDPSADQGTDTFLREYITKSPKECKNQIRRIGEEILHMKAVRAGKIPILKTPQNDCNFCDFFELCETDEAGGDTEYLEQAMFDIQDPYADHREGAENSKASVQNKVKTGVR